MEVAQVATGVARGDRAQRRPDRGDRPRPRLRPRARGPRQRGGPRPLRRRRIRPRPVGRRASRWPAQPVSPRPSTASPTTRGRARRPPRPRAKSSAGPTASPTSATTSRTPSPRASSTPRTCRALVRERCGETRGTPARAFITSLVTNGARDPASSAWTPRTPRRWPSSESFNYRAIYMRGALPAAGRVGRRAAGRAGRVLRASPPAHPRRRRAGPAATTRAPRCTPRSATSRA